jgi:citrate synthase
MFTALFAIPRMAGWLAQWDEMLRDPEQKIARPRQVYIGQGLRKIPAEFVAAGKTRSFVSVK